LKVQKVSWDVFQDIDEDVDEDLIIIEAFQLVLVKQLGYCRGLGAGIKPTRGKVYNFKSRI